MLNSRTRFADLRSVKKNMHLGKNLTKHFQEEEADGKCDLFAFAYNQWLSKARMMALKRAESQNQQDRLENGDFPEDMTDQVGELIESECARVCNFNAS